MKTMEHTHTTACCNRVRRPVQGTQSRHTCSGHGPGHLHRPGCGHPRKAHGDHLDYVVGGHLHHLHDGHCDDHGSA